VRYELIDPVKCDVRCKSTTDQASLLNPKKKEKKKERKQKLK